MTDEASFPRRRNGRKKQTNFSSREIAGWDADPAHLGHFERTDIIQYPTAQRFCCCCCCFNFSRNSVDFVLGIWCETHSLKQNTKHYACNINAHLPLAITIDPLKSVGTQAPSVFYRFLSSVCAYLFTDKRHCPQRRNQHSFNAV